MLSPDMRRRWLLLVPLAVITGVAEMGTAAGIFALVALLTNDRAALPGWCAAMLGHLPWQGPRAIVVQACSLLAVYYALKTLITVGGEYMRIRISHDACAELASGMLRRYLSAPALVP